MKLIETKCPNCGASMSYDAEQGNATCKYCGSSLIVDKETKNLHVENSEELGYQFEKGRQRAQAEASKNNASFNYSPAPQPKKRKTWLRVLGWIFIFPLPLTLILLKKPDMDKKIKYIIIAIAWVVYFVIGMTGAANNNDNKTTKSENSTVATETTEAEETTEQETTEEETTEEETTEKQTKEPTTEKVTEKIAELPTEAVTPFEIVNYSSEVAAGSNANIKIKGKPNTEYTIDVVYNSGSSKAEGLEPKISDSYGNVSWEWEVGTKTTPGTYSITVNGGGTFKSVKFTVFNNN